MQRIILYMLMVVGLLSLGFPGCENSVLNIQNLDHARASEIVVIKIVDGAGNPVPEVRIYSPGYLGDTNNDGNLVTFFKGPGDYELLARKGVTGEPSFTETTGAISIIPGYVELKAFDGVEPLLPPGDTYIGEQHYKPGMIVRFNIKNIGNTEITLNNSAPWVIQTLEGDMVFEPVALPTIVQLAPGEDKEWTWHQIDNNGLQINEGGYKVVINCSEGEYGLRFWGIPEGISP